MNQTKKYINFILFFSILVRIVMWTVHNNSPSPLGPDEGTYAALARWMDEGKTAESFPAYGSGLYLSMRFYIIMSIFLNNYFDNYLNSVRAVSLVFGILNLIVFKYLLLKVYLFLNLNSSNLKSAFLMSLFFVYSFLPSHLLWATIGLKESITEFFILLIIYGIFSQKRLFLSSTIIFSALFVLYSTRPQFALITTFSLFIYYFYSLILRDLPKLAIIKILVLLIVSIVSFNYSKGTLGRDTTNSFVEDRGTLGRDTNTQFLLNSKSTNKFVDNIEKIRVGNTVNADSAIDKTKCEDLRCLLKSIPIGVYNSSFKPNLFDMRSKTQDKIASLENIFWIFGILYCIFAMFRKPKLFIIPKIVFIYSQFLLIIVGLALYEGNYGTAFRHKSVLLPFIILIIMFSFTHTSLKNLELKLR